MLRGEGLVTPRARVAPPLGLARVSVSFGAARKTSAPSLLHGAGSPCRRPPSLVADATFNAMVSCVVQEMGASVAVTMNKAACPRATTEFGHMAKYGMTRDRPTIRAYDLRVCRYWSVENVRASPQRWQGRAA